MKALTVFGVTSFVLLASNASAQFATNIANQYQMIPNVTYLTAGGQATERLAIAIFDIIVPPTSPKRKRSVR